MNKYQQLTGSIKVLVGVSVALMILMIVAVMRIADFVADRSLSVNDNFLLVGGFMVFVLLVSLIELLLVKRVVWGTAMVSGATARLGVDDEMKAEVRSMRATGAKLGLILTTLLVINILLFDSVGRGVLVLNTRVYWVLTLLRSPNGADREEAVPSAIMLIGNEKVARALGRTIEQPGEARHWAAYAAGVRNDVTLIDPLKRLMRSGTPIERAAAGVALSRMAESNWLNDLPTAYQEAGKHRNDFLKAVGYLGKKRIPSEEDRRTASTFLLSLLTDDKLDRETIRLAVWALGKLESPLAYGPIEQLLERGTDVGTMCTGLEALGRIGSDTSSKKMMAMVYTVDRETRCPDLVYRDFSGQEVLLCGGLNLVQRLLRETARIGDRSVKPTMDKIAEDESFSKGVRSMAREIAFQMKYKR